MSPTAAIDRIPLWLLFVVTVAVTFAAVELGMLLGRRRKERSPDREAPLGAMVGAMLGLLAFVLAFTFGLAASRFDERRHTILDEANAIGTTYLRAGLLPEPQRSSAQGLLRAYVDARLAAVDPGKLEQAINTSVELHDQLWTEASASAAADPHSIVVGLFIQSLNQMIDLHATRVMVGLRSRIPTTVWVALYFVAIVTMATMGYHHGLSGTSRPIASLALVLVFAVILLLVLDLDRPLEGFLRVSQQSVLDLRQSMRESPTSAPTERLP